MSDTAIRQVRRCRCLLRSIDLKGSSPLPESWNCVDCGVNTAPGGFPARADADKALVADWADLGIEVRFGPDSEVYIVRDKVWEQAGVEPMGGCLCIGCLEKRIGRRLKPKDFPRHHPFNSLPGSARLMKRRGD
jgi:hypothetical protein